MTGVVINMQNTTKFEPVISTGFYTSVNIKTPHLLPSKYLTVPLLETSNTFPISGNYGMIYHLITLSPLSLPIFRENYDISSTAQC